LLAEMEVSRTEKEARLSPSSSSEETEMSQERLRYAEMEALRTEKEAQVARNNINSAERTGKRYKEILKSHVEYFLIDAFRAGITM
jgi:hypothetical protein